MEPIDDAQTRSSGPRFSPWRLLPLALIAAGFGAAIALGLDDYLSFEALHDHRQSLIAWRNEHHLLMAVAYVATYALLVTFSVPGAIWMTIGGGFLFGPFVGTVLVVVGATVGATALFLAARHALGEYFLAKAGPAVRKMEAGFKANALSYLLVLRLIPLFPFWLVNLVPAFLGVPLAVYFLGTLIGIVPGTFVYALVGNGLGAVIDAGKVPELGIILEPEFLAPIAGLAVLSLIPVAYKRFRDKRP